MPYVAKVIPLRRLPSGKDTFDYLIPDELLQRVHAGARVRIPFQHAEIAGVVVEQHVIDAASNLQLKSILSVESGVGMTPWQLELVRILQATTAASAGTCSRIFHLDLFKSLPETKKIRSTTIPQMPTLITAAPTPQLILSLIHESRPTQTRLIILPLRYEALQLSAQLPASLRIHTFIPPTSASAARSLMRDMANHTPCTVIGTKSAVFLPWQHVDEIIIVRAEAEDYANHEQSPRYDIRELLFTLPDTTRPKLTLVSQTPRLEEYARYAEKQLKNKKPAISQKLPEITLADLKDLDRGRYNTTLTESAIEHMRASLEANKQVVIITGSKGAGVAPRCKDCGWTPQCETCQLPYRVELRDTKHILHCTHCDTETLFPAECPSCHNTTFTHRRKGMEALLEDAKSQFPNVTIASVEKGKRHGSPNAQITIGTLELIQSPAPEGCNLMILADADTELQRQGFRAAEHTLQLTQRLRTWAFNAERIIIQTRLPDHPVFTAVTESKASSWYASELNLRKELALPPAHHRIALMRTQKNNPNTSAEECIAAITTQNPGVSITASTFEKSGVTLSSPTTLKIPPMPRGWTIDPYPQ